MEPWMKWIAVAGLAAQLGELGYLGRVHELHHGYYGATAMVVGSQVAPKHRVLGRTLEFGGSFLLADDLYQHGVQSYEKATGQPIRPDFTPVHRMGAKVYGFILHIRF